MPSPRSRMSAANEDEETWSELSRNWITENQLDLRSGFNLVMIISLMGIAINPSRPVINSVTQLTISFLHREVSPMDAGPLRGDHRRTWNRRAVVENENPLALREANRTMKRKCCPIHCVFHLRRRDFRN